MALASKQVLLSLPGLLSLPRLKKEAEKTGDPDEPDDNDGDDSDHTPPKKSKKVKATDDDEEAYHAAVRATAAAIIAAGRREPTFARLDDPCFCRTTLHEEGILKDRRCIGGWKELMQARGTQKWAPPTSTKGSLRKETT